MILEQLTFILPNSAGRASDWLDPINNAMNEWGVHSAKDQAMFLAQIMYESNGLQRVEENLCYSATGLASVWPSRFGTFGVDGKIRPGIPNGRAILIAHNSQLIGNAVYADRMGNGDENSGDGYKYRGRGLIQITGKANYQLIGNLLKLDLVGNPDQLKLPGYAARSAGAYWSHNGLSVAAETGDVAMVTRKINGGEEGLPGRQAYYKRACDALGVK